MNKFIEIQSSSYGTRYINVDTIAELEFYPKTEKFTVVGETCWVFSVKVVFLNKEYQRIGYKIFGDGNHTNSLTDSYKNSVWDRVDKWLIEYGFQI
jgi:hypothetical protein